MIKLIGGAGFVGTRLSELLDDSVCLDKRLTGENYCDITCYNSILTKISNEDVIVLLAAEHRDDVSPASKYYETNVRGTQKVLEVMDEVGCNHLIFTSSVAVYGLNKANPGENHPVDPFNHYGRSKYEAENIIKAWYEKEPNGKSVTIIRPTVIFGERNRGNVYNLLNQITSGRFLMVGKGQNKKSMAYIGNIVDFIKHRVEKAELGLHVFNYVDKPDLSMSALLSLIQLSLNKQIPSVRIPIWLGYAGGYWFDFLTFVTGKKYAVSSVRIKKFIATTQFDAKKVHSGEWKAPYTLEEGLDRTLNYEFVQERSDDDEVFYTE